MDDTVAFATTGPFVIAIWRGAPTRARLELGLSVMDAHALAMGSRIGAVSVIEEGAPPPGPEDIQFLQAYFPKLSRVVVAMVGVFETTAPDEHGRDAGEAIGGDLGLRLEAKLCFAVEEACTWIVPRIAPTSDPLYRRDLARTIEEVRESITSPRATR